MIKIEYFPLDGIDNRYLKSIMMMIPNLHLICEDYHFEEILEHIEFNLRQSLKAEKASPGSHKLAVEVNRSGVGALVTIIVDGDPFLRMEVSIKQEQLITEVRADVIDW